MRRSREQLGMGMTIDKFIIIERDNMTIACATLYPFPDEQYRENGLCGGVSRLSQFVTRRDAVDAHRATGASNGVQKMFVLTTRSIHWFQELGFTPAEVDILPNQKKGAV